MKLHLAKDFSLPVDAVTQKLGFIGVSGSGKSYAASKLAELMWHAKAQFVVLDPVGIWYGLRLAKDGKKPGIGIPVFGGLHGDVPLEETGGKLIAELIAERGISAVIDVSQFESDAAKARFAADFADRFFFLKKARSSAVHLFLEEAQEFVPQNPQKGEERMLHFFHRLQKLGRNFGIGTSIITQRPQETSKKALNQAQTLFVFRLTGSQERDAIERWVSEKGLADSVLKDLAKLPTGDCHLWSPAWLNVFRMMRVLPKETFDASATPEVGAHLEARNLAPIELDQIRTDMAATIEKAKENDPAALKRRIAELQKHINATQLQLEHFRDQAPTAKTDPAALERARAQGFRDSDVLWVKRVNERDALMAALKKRVQSAAGLLEEGLARFVLLPPESAARSVTETHEVLPARSVVSQERPARTFNGSMPAGGGLRRMLNVLGQYPEGRSRKQLAFIAGLSPNSGTFSTYLGQLRSEGLMEGQPDRLTITPAGVDKLGPIDPLPQGDELFEYWCKETGGGMERMLRALKDGPLSREQLGEVAGMSANSGTFSTYLGRLRTLELIKGSREIALSEEILG